MSTVEIALRKVKGLSESQAQELLHWLAARQPRSSANKIVVARRRRNRKARPTMRQITAWYHSIRGTTDWEPPRMPPDHVHQVSL